MTLTVPQLTAIMPRLGVAAERWLFPLRTTALVFEITSAVRLAAFLAQLAHESTELTRLEENLNYSAEGLLRTWPARFNAQEAAVFARRPERIAERAYGGRLGNGPEGSGDGWLYRGRGPIGLTFLDNYREAGTALGLDLEKRPELVMEPLIGALCAGRFWKTRGCNELADAGDIRGLTRRINGGLTGLAEREAYWRTAKTVLE